MVAAFLAFIAPFIGTISETPLFAYDLAVNIANAEKIEYVRMTDDDGNVRFMIDFYKFPIENEMNFERKLNHKNRAYYKIKKDIKKNGRNKKTV